MIPLFVYGTLKRLRGNNWLLNGISEFVGDAVTVEKYPFISFHLPIVFDSPNNSDGRHVKGELHLIEPKSLYSIDSLEGHPYHYERKIIEIVVNGGTTEAWCYMQPEKDFVRFKSIGRSYTQYIIDEY